MAILTRNRVLTICAFIFMALYAPCAAQANETTAEVDPNKPIFVDFKNIVVPVIKKNGSTGIIAISMMAQVPNQSAQDKVTNNMPRLRDAFIRTLYGSLESNRFVRDDGALDIENIKQSLMKTANYVMKEKENPINDILFQNIAQQTY
jgi:flagellar basal body-associated protein FliL